MDVPLRVAERPRWKHSESRAPRFCPASVSACAMAGLVAGLCILFSIPAAAQTQYPKGPEENFDVIRLEHRDAGEVARIIEQVLVQTEAPGERARGILTVDPELNAIIVRAAGPGATWPATVQAMVKELDQPTKATTLEVSLWRTGWAPGVPASKAARAEMEAVLGEQPGEKLDAFRIPVETGTFFSAWLESPGKPVVRAVGVVSGNPEDNATLRILPLRVELVEMGVPPGFAIEGTGAAPASIPREPDDAAQEGSPAERGEKDSLEGTQTAQEAEVKAAGRKPGTGEASMKEEVEEEARPTDESAGTDAGAGVSDRPLLPPPYGEVVFAGPVTVRGVDPAVVGPFSVPELEGQLVVSVRLIVSPR